MRGEYGVTTCTESFCWELPPRARRIRFQPYKPWGLDGTTSACAENTPILCRFQTTIRNYLRVRGEYHNSVVSNKPAAELPPRARRILALGIECFDTHGTTSACAENTVHNRKFWCRFRNYLRVRGEYDHPLSATDKIWELPPRARRILKNCIANCITLGTTSACAENTCAPWGDVRHLWNYLRVRGEYILMAAHLITTRELPPRARRILYLVF